MGFLAAYSGTERVDLGDGYWVEVKKCLSHDEKAAADAKLERVTGEIDEGKTKMVGSPDLPAWRQAMVLASIVDWNLDEEDGTKWAVSPDSAKRRNVGRLPSPAFDAIWKKVNALNAPLSTDDRKSVPDGRGAGAEGERGGAGDGADVPDGAAAVAEAGAAPGGPGTPALA